MDDALLVRGFEGISDLCGDQHGVGERDRPAGDHRRQILALGQFHHQGRQVRGLLDAVNRGDVRMIERGEDFGLALTERDDPRRRRPRPATL